MFNLGYGFVESSGMTSASQILASMFVELVLELVIDSMALSIEYENGIDMDLFWKRMSAGRPFVNMLCEYRAFIHPRPL